MREDLGPIAQPSEIELRTALPKTRSGKIVRRLLKAQEMGEDPGDLSTITLHLSELSQRFIALTKPWSSGSSTATTLAVASALTARHTRPRNR